MDIVEFEMISYSKLVFWEEGMNNAEGIIRSLVVEYLEKNEQRSSEEAIEKYEEAIKSATNIVDGIDNNTEITCVNVKRRSDKLEVMLIFELAGSCYIQIMDLGSASLPGTPHIYEYDGRHRIEYEWDKAFARLVRFAKYENHKIIISIPEPNLY